MSSRSTSPFPPSDTKSETTGALSNDALYAPLSTYNGASNNNTRHSLTLQTSTSLRESSLLAFLSSTSSSLKTSHPYESSIYKSIGGSLTKNGMGDNDHAGEISKSFYESKLSNRSLVLVGGGVHSHAERGDGSITSMVGQASASGKKRERKRVGGNGMFGSLSGTKRKKILKKRRVGDVMDLQSEALSGDSNDAKQTESPSVNDQFQINKVIETIHNMWTGYISELLADTKPESATSTDQKPKTNKPPSNPLITLQIKRQMALLLIEAEHVGMAATIVECPSRRDLTHHRCVVVNETVNTYKAAMLMDGRSKTKKKKNAGQNGDDCRSGENDVSEATAQTPCRAWKVVMIPKQGTVLEVTVSLPRDMHDSDVASISLRLET